MGYSPMVELIEQGQTANDQLMDVTGCAASQAVEEFFALQVTAGVPLRKRGLL